MDAPKGCKDGLSPHGRGTDPAALPRISVVVPSYNQGHFLPDTLKSIFRQNYPDLEVVVIDGGSTDGSVDVIRSYASRLKHWQSERDGGQSAAINAGVKHCSGELVTWLNSDDFYWGESLWVVGRAWAAYPGRGLYIGNGLRHDQRTGKSVPFLPRHMALNRAVLREGPDYLLQPSTFFLREAWEAVGGLDNDLRFCMDWDIFLRIVKRYPVVLINEFLGVSREYEETKTRSGKTTRAFEIIRMIQRHTQTELTLGSLGYLLETLLGAMDGQLSDKLREHINWSLVWTFKSFHRNFGDGWWSPAHGDARDDVYLPFAGQALPPRRPDAPPLPPITVVIPSRNERAALEQTLASVLNQDYSPLEVLVVDAESTDGPDELRERYADRATWLRCPADCSTVRAINQGLAAAQGEVVTWLCPGDLLAVGALRAAGEAFRADGERELIYGNAVFIDPQDRLALVDLPPCRTGFWIGDFSATGGVPGYGAEVYQVPQPTVYLRRNLLEKCGPLDESYHSIFDYEYVRRLAGRTRVHKLERTQALVRIGADEAPERWTRDPGRTVPLQPTSVAEPVFPTIRRRPRSLRNRLHAAEIPGEAARSAIVGRLFSDRAQRRHARGEPRTLVERSFLHTALGRTADVPAAALRSHLAVAAPGRARRTAAARRSCVPHGHDHAASAALSRTVGERSEGVSAPRLSAALLDRGILHATRLAVCVARGDALSARGRSAHAPEPAEGAPRSAPPRFSEKAAARSNFRRIAPPVPPHPRTAQPVLRVEAVSHRAGPLVSGDPERLGTPLSARFLVCRRPDQPSGIDAEQRRRADTIDLSLARSGVGTAAARGATSARLDSARHVP